MQYQVFGVWWRKRFLGFLVSGVWCLPVSYCHCTIRRCWVVGQCQKQFVRFVALKTWEATTTRCSDISRLGNPYCWPVPHLLGVPRLYRRYLVTWWQRPRTVVYVGLWTPLLPKWSLLEGCKNDFQILGNHFLIRHLMSKKSTLLLGGTLNLNIECYVQYYISMKINSYRRPTVHQQYIVVRCINTTKRIAIDIFSAPQDPKFAGVLRTTKQ